MNPYLKGINRVEFVITNACTGKCKHCSEGCHSVIGERIDKEIAVRTLEKICYVYPIKTVMTFGGEPLLYPDTVCAIHTLAAACGVSKRQIITNGYFSTDHGAIQSVAERIAASGVNDLRLSVDFFHQETIPLEYVKAFAAHIKALGVPIKTQPAWLVSRDDDNPYNIVTKELLSHFSDMGIQESEGNVIFPQGNALIYLKDYFPSDAVPKNPYWEDPFAPHTLSISADGQVLDGNLYDADILDIISTYTPPSA